MSNKNIDDLSVDVLNIIFSMILRNISISTFREFLSHMSERSTKSIKDLWKPSVTYILSLRSTTRKWKYVVDKNIEFCNIINYYVQKNFSYGFHCAVRIIDWTYGIHIVSMKKSVLLDETDPIRISNCWCNGSVYLQITEIEKTYPVTVVCYDTEKAWIHAYPLHWRDYLTDFSYFVQGRMPIQKPSITMKKVIKTALKEKIAFYEFMLEEESKLLQRKKRLDLKHQRLVLKLSEVQESLKNQKPGKVKERKMREEAFRSGKICKNNKSIQRISHELKKFSTIRELKNEYQKRTLDYDDDLKSSEDSQNKRVKLTL